MKTTSLNSLLVSVIVPAYNAGKFISDAIGSVLQQTHHCFELIVIDDGSNDDTQAVVKSFVDPRIYLITQSSNQGASVARNLGIASANGDYIAFLDADDLWAPDFLGVMLKHITRSSASLVYCHAEFTDFSCAAVGVPFGKSESADVDTIDRCLEDVFRNPYMATCAIVCKRSLFDHCDMFDSRFPTAEDIDFVLRVAETGSIAHVPMVLAQVRVRGGSLGSRANSYSDHLAVLDVFFARNPDFKKVHADLVSEVLEEIYYCYVRQLLVDRAFGRVLEVMSGMPKNAFSLRILRKALKIVPLYFRELTRP